jgi:hypothetical protein
MAVLIIEDLVSRKWITEIVSVEETSTQVELAFTAALEAEGLLDAVDARHEDGLVDIGFERLSSRPQATMATSSSRTSGTRTTVVSRPGRPRLTVWWPSEP